MSGARPQPWGDAKPQDLSLIKELPRLRVEYAKGDRLAFLGHLEVLETINRCIRRAQLPFSIGNGFARRMRIQFSQALPVGASSVCEYFDLRLSEEVPVDEVLVSLRAATPLALAPSRAAYVDGRALALDTRSSNAGALRPQLLIDHALAGAAGEARGYDCLKVCRTSQAHEDANSGLLVNPL